MNVCSDYWSWLFTVIHLLSHSKPINCFGKQSIVKLPLTFTTATDATLGLNCTFHIKKGRCGVNTHLQTDVTQVDVSQDPLAGLCFLWSCDGLDKYGMLVRKCVARSRSGTDYSLIDDGCGQQSSLFTPKPTTPAYSYNLLGARAQLPTPFFTDSDAFISCELSFCPICECDGITPPLNCYDYSTDIRPLHRNVELLEHQPVIERPECNSVAMTAASNQTNLNNNVTSLSDQGGRAVSEAAYGTRTHSPAWLIGTLVTFLLVIVLSCRIS